MNPLARHGIRFLSTYRRPPKAAKSIASNCITELARSSNDPTWRLLECLGSHRHIPQPDKFHPSTGLGRATTASTLAPCGATTTSWARLRPILRQPDIESALNTFSQTQQKPILSLPPWLLLYLVAYKVHNPQHATGSLLSTVFDHLDHLPPSPRSGLLILATLHFTRFAMVVPLARMVIAFLAIPLSPREAPVHFNHMLIALTSATSTSSTLNKLVLQILLAMESRHIQLNTAMYQHLLSDRLITLELTKYLRDRMVRQGFVPEVEHLEAYIRIFAKGGLIEDARAYQHALENMPGVSPSALSRANTSMIQTHMGDPASAFAFLKRISEPPYPNPSSENPFHAGPTREFSVRDWTAAFSVLAKYPMTNAHTLHRQFSKSAHSVPTAHRPAFRPTVVTYTILIRTLIRKGQYELAESTFYDLRKSGLSINSAALSIGISALTLAGRPHRALTALEQYASRTDAPAPAEHKIFTPVTFKILDMNHFLPALLKIGRPDVVFALWDRMGVLYGLQANEWTLSLLIQATRISVQLDNNLWARFRSWRQKAFSMHPAHGVTQTFPFGSAPAPNATIPPRADILQGIADILVNPDAKPGAKAGAKLLPYKSGVWCHQLPARRMKTIFFRILFNYAPDLAHVNAPVEPMEDSGQDVWRWFNVLPTLTVRKPVEWVIPEDVLPPASPPKEPNGRILYPGIIPSSRNFFDFMMLLALNPPCGPHVSHTWGTGRSLLEMSASEVPLLLAWMRKLDITPTKKTLALALEMWKEITMQAPLLEDMMGSNSGYNRLVQWLTDWVGQARMPQPGDEHFELVRKMLREERAGEGWPMNLAVKNRRWFSSQVLDPGFQKVDRIRDKRLLWKRWRKTNHTLRRSEDKTR